TNSGTTSVIIQAAWRLRKGCAPGLSLITMQSLIAGAGTSMASITIRNLDERTKARLRVRAAHRRRSMEEEARQILREALAEDVKPAGNLVERIRRRLAPFGGLDLDLPPREPIREPPGFGKPRRR